MSEKIFRDLFNREIKSGDKVLHLWCEKDEQGGIRGGKKAVRHKHAHVINFSEKTVRIEWQNEDGDIIQSSIKNTSNRIIILTEDSNLIERAEYKVKVEIQEKLLGKLYKKVARTEEKLKDSQDLNKRINKGYLADRKNDELKIAELQETIDELCKGSERFSMLDL